MEWVISSVVVISLLATIFAPINKARFQKMDDRKLLENSVSAKAMRKKMLFLQYLGWIPFLFVMWLCRDYETSKYLIVFITLVVMGSLASRKMFGRIAEATTVEIELRKLQRTGENKPPITDQ